MWCPFSTFQIEPTLPNVPESRLFPIRHVQKVRVDNMIAARGNCLAVATFIDCREIDPGQ